MKKLLLLFLALPLLFCSCEKDENNALTIDDVLKVADAYILNYGSYSSTEGSLTAISTIAYDSYNNIYQLANGSVKMSGKPQYFYEYNDSYYFMGNAKDEIFFIDKTTLKQSKNGVSEDIVKPRYCVGYGDYLYISCYGGEPWVDATVGYIAKYNVTTNTVESKIDVAGGPEGLEIANGKLYCALNYKMSIAVMDLSSESLSYIETPAVTSYFLKDDSNNLYVSLVSTYSDYSAETGIGYINTTTDELSEIYQLDNVSSNYSSIMSFNSDQSKIYVAASSWVEEGEDNWIQKGGVFEFDVENKTFDYNAYISSIDGLNGLSVNPVNDDLYVMISENTTATGELKIYDNTGKYIKSCETSISPGWVMYR